MAYSDDFIEKLLNMKKLAEAREVVKNYVPNSFTLGESGELKKSGNFQLGEGNSLKYQNIAKAKNLPVPYKQNQVGQVAKKVSQSSSEEINKLFGNTKNIAKELSKKGSKYSKIAKNLAPIAKVGGAIGAISNISSGIGNIKQGRTGRGILDALQTAGYTSALVAPNPVTGVLAGVAGTTDLAEMVYDYLNKKNKKQTNTQTSTPIPTQTQITPQEIEAIDKIANGGNGIGSVPSTAGLNYDYRGGNQDNLANLINSLSSGENYQVEEVNPTLNNIQTQQLGQNVEANPEALQQAFDDMLARYQASNQQRQDIYKPELDYLQKLIDNANYVNQWQQINQNVASGLAGIAGNRAIYDSAVANNPMKYLLEKEGLIGKQAQLRDELRFDPNQVLANAEFASSMGYNPMMALASKDILNAIAMAGKLEQQQKYQQALIDLKNQDAVAKQAEQRKADEKWAREFGLKEEELNVKRTQKDQPKFSDVRGIRTEFNGLPVVKNFNEVNSKTNNVNSMYEQYLNGKVGRNAFDQALITTVNKLLDPNSVVRESEYDRSMNGQAMWNKITGYATKLSKGGAGLTDAERRDFVNSINIMNQAYKTELDATVRDYTDLAQRYGINPADVMPRYYKPQSDANSITQKLQNAGYTQEQINEYLKIKGLK